MNGRVYDPQIGRFLSADPYIQDPYNTQSYNRYSYVMNNPLKYTDPSGYSWNPIKAVAKAWRSAWRGVKKYGRVIIAAVIAYYTGGLVANSAWANCTVVGSSWVGTAVAGAAGGAAFGASSTLLYGGSVSDAIKAAAIGAVSGAISGGISGSYGNTWNAQRIGASAMGSGISAELQGGSFKDGFKAGMISSSLRYLYNKVVRYDIDARAGGEAAAPIKGENRGPLKGYNNIGIQDDSLSIFYEGKALSKVLNIIPAGINAVAGLHDKFQVSMTGWVRNVFNVPGMIPAAVITYGGMADAYGISAQLTVKDRIRK
ncbi:hypothetical protein BPUTSESOX_475 [uncultured Gammaproteobacteria bacterium]|uniref:RHS repeat-associated core domain-containing protein n=1 Tax=thiotrophic endosymbiont of Bathymodiolus puteoserpentis (Logatchev) TaxID=343240 RepID=UPI0010BB84E1|nr:RHS repeat-associated core domain-containing protein [thiotrophic endosymbiont of Bathymodiolus puteoserpentis (Logatchev)]SSC11118.1 hypothetical protein BPUTEOSOX_1401 [thiotrophic endosymbiont of Bathymodiolus puteoserpentis (Logatchev)]VVH52322.1 hypothetical protein BPUTSESOX_475 [uncultured Gammaproteobacteria bacterium]